MAKISAYTDGNKVRLHVGSGKPAFGETWQRVRGFKLDNIVYGTVREHNLTFSPHGCGKVLAALHCPTPENHAGVWLEKCLLSGKRFGKFGKVLPLDLAPENIKVSGNPWGLSQKDALCLREQLSEFAAQHLAHGMYRECGGGLQCDSIFGLCPAEKFDELCAAYGLHSGVPCEVKLDVAWRLSRFGIGVDGWMSKEDADRWFATVKEINCWNTFEEIRELLVGVYQQAEAAVG